MDPAQAFQHFGLALLMGLLVGMQRERSQTAIAGIRTFPLVTVGGTLCAHLAQAWGGWIIAAGLAGVTALAVAAYVTRSDRGESHGLTTEFALIAMFAVGAYVVVGPQPVAVAVGCGVAVLLQFKPELHGLARRLEEPDLRAIMQFVLIAFIVLPVLPSRNYGPWSVLNPREIWLMVVLIVGISVIGLIVQKLYGENAGTLLGGIMGGIISSTATTASYARRTRSDEASVPASALVVLIASTVLYGRVLVEIQVVAPGFLWEAAPRVAAMLLASLVLIALLWRSRRPQGETATLQPDQSELKTAILFGVLYAAVLLGVAAARHYLGSGGLFVVAAISGMTDMDAITLSTSRLVATGHLESRIGWQMIVTATLSNLVFKAGLALMLGHRALAPRVALVFGVPFLVGLGTLFF